MTVRMNRSAGPGGTPAPSRSKKTAAWSFVIIAFVALGISAWYGRQRYLRENPPPLPDVIAPIPPEEQEALRTGMKILGKTILQLTPEQEKQMAGIWDKPPRSLDEVIERQKKVNAILTEEQRARLKPIRQGFQGRIVDRMLEPARERFPEEDFEKLKKEVKARVETRIEGP